MLGNLLGKYFKWSLKLNCCPVLYLKHTTEAKKCCPHIRGGHVFFFVFFLFICFFLNAPVFRPCQVNPCDGVHVNCYFTDFWRRIHQHTICHQLRLKLEQYIQVLLHCAISHCFYFIFLREKPPQINRNKCCPNDT